MRHKSNISKIAVYFVLAAAFLFVAVRIVLAASDLDFTLHNKTGKTIHHLYVTGHDDDEWGDDVLGKDVLDDGESAEIKFSEGKESATYDIKLEFDDKSTGVWKNFDLKTITDITVSYKDGVPWANWK